MAEQHQQRFEMTEDRHLRLARRRAGAKIGFLTHLTVFIAVNGGLMLINLTITPQQRWFPYPLGGWTLGLAIHGLLVFWPGFGLREKLVESELRRLERQHPRSPSVSRLPENHRT